MAVVFGATLFLAAGTIAWAGAWTFLALFLGFVIALSAWLLGFDPGAPCDRGRRLLRMAGRDGAGRSALWLVAHVSIRATTRGGPATRLVLRLLRHIQREHVSVAGRSSSGPLLLRGR